MALPATGCASYPYTLGAFIEPSGPRARWDAKARAEAAPAGASAPELFNRLRDRGLVKGALDRK